MLFLLSILIGASIGMLGMGGVFLTPVLIVVMGLPISTAMGTALATFIGTGLLGSYLYYRQGNVKWFAALLLGGTSTIGAILGSNFNLFLSKVKLKVGLAVFLAMIGIFTIIREKFDVLQTDWSLNLTGISNKLIFSLIGINIGFASGLLGVGGPVLLVPILVVLGWPMLIAVGVSQVVSVFSAVAGSISYLLHGKVELWLAFWALSGELLGVISGGYLAHQIEGRKLKLVLGSMLIGLSIYFVSDYLRFFFVRCL